MINKKQDQSLSTYFKPKQPSQQQSFIKQYQQFLSKNRKTTPLKDISTRRQLVTSKQFIKNSASPLAQHSNCNSNFNSKQANQFKSTIQNDVIRKIRHHQTASPQKEQNSFQIQINHSLSKDKKISLFDCESNPTKSLISSTSFEKSISAVSIFQESTKQLEELQQEKDKPELQKGITGILSLIKKEKQVIINDMKQMTKQMNKYKLQYEELQLDYDQLKQQHDRLQDAQELSQTQKAKVNDTYSQMIQLLKTISVEYQEILPELGSDGVPQDSSSQPDKEEIIILQKLIIKKLVKKLEDTKQFNQLLLTKLKQQ